jgi:hypothetical protein
LLTVQNKTAPTVHRGGSVSFQKATSPSPRIRQDDKDNNDEQLIDAGRTLAHVQLHCVGRLLHRSKVMDNSTGDAIFYGFSVL